MRSASASDGDHRGWPLAGDALWLAAPRVGDPPRLRGERLDGDAPRCDELTALSCISASSRPADATFVEVEIGERPYG